MKTGWDCKWPSESEKDYWNKPDKYVIAFSDKYLIRDGCSVLDLGCGIGRHTVCFAERGARVFAVDESCAAIARLIEKAGKMRLDIQAAVCNYLNFEPLEKFDYIIAFNVIYHGDGMHFAKSVDKCHELLKPGGRLFFTCPTRDDEKYGSGEMAAEHTYKSMNSVHPGDVHYFTCESELEVLMDKFNEVITEKEEHYWNNNGKEQFASNYIVTARKPE